MGCGEVEVHDDQLTEEGDHFLGGEEGGGEEHEGDQAGGVGRQGTGGGEEGGVDVFADAGEGEPGARGVTDPEGLEDGAAHPTQLEGREGEEGGVGGGEDGGDAGIRQEGG